MENIKDIMNLLRRYEVLKESYDEMTKFISNTAQFLFAAETVQAMEEDAEEKRMMILEKEKQIERLKANTTREEKREIMRIYREKYQLKTVS
jgi:hypothetical protein